MITDVIIINVSVIVLKSSRQCSNEAFKVVTKQKKKKFTVGQYHLQMCAQSKLRGWSLFVFEEQPVGTKYAY